LAARAQADTQAVTGPAWVALGAAAVSSAANLTAILRHDKRLEYAAKPTVMALLILVALLLHPASQAERACFVVAVALGLAGDVFLMLRHDYLVAGLLAFLAGHVAYIVGFRFGAFELGGLVVGAVIVTLTAALALRRILAALRAGDRARLQVPVVAYVVVISLMTVSATASGSLIAAAGGLLFFFSDLLFSWYRFVRPLSWGQPLNIVMYQSGQALLVLSLASSV